MIDPRAELLAGARAKYEHFSKAVAAFTEVSGQPYKNKKFQTVGSFLCVLELTNHRCPDVETAERLLKTDLNELYDEVFRIWVVAASRELARCKEALGQYKKAVEGKRQLLPTVAAAPTEATLKERINTQAEFIKTLRRSPPTLTDPLKDDWSKHLSSIMDVRTNLRGIHTDMVDTTAKAQKEYREKSNDARGKIGLVLTSISAGAALTALALKWGEIVALLALL